MSDGIEAPVGIEIGLKFYLVSSDDEMEAVMSLDGLPRLLSFEGERDPAKIAEWLRLPLADKWRLMTREELVDYKRRQKEEEDRERAIVRGDDEVDE